MCDKLVEAGYKVARVEQTESTHARDARILASASKNRADEKVVSREICRINTAATRTASDFDAEPNSEMSVYLLAICERRGEHNGVLQKEFGICFVDTSIGKFHLGQFTDDRDCSRLRTLIVHFPPKQVLLDSKSISAGTTTILKHCIPDAMKEKLRSGDQFLSVTSTFKVQK